MVSGLAAGIDTAAHHGALDAEDGRTVAVLGSGIRVHPPPRKRRARRAYRRARRDSFRALPTAPPRGPQLMARDRLISGLSRAVIVIEAGAKSGSLDTAERARKQGRLVYAVPGSPGTDSLLKGGALRVDTDFSDYDTLANVIYEYQGEQAKPSPPQASLF